MNPSVIVRCESCMPAYSRIHQQDVPAGRLSCPVPSQWLARRAPHAVGRCRELFLCGQYSTRLQLHLLRPATSSLRLTATRAFCP